MPPAVRAPAFISEADYLAFEAASPEKHEYVNGEIIDMAGGSLGHGLIQANLIRALGNRLQGAPCRSLGSEVRVQIKETGMYAYPDVVVYCGEAELSETIPPSLLNPRVLIEVLSASTEVNDRGVKVAHYRHRASVDAIVLIDSRTRLVEIQTRNPNGTWTLDERTSGDLPIAVLDVVIPFDEVYEGVTIIPPPAPPSGRKPRPRELKPARAAR